MNLLKIHNNLNKLNVIDIMIDVFDELDKFISDLNRAQLLDGKRDDGSDIEPDYTENTTIIKELTGIGFGKITDRVTLYDTGDLHKSIFSSVSYPEIILDSNDPKVSELESKYKNFLGLTDESITKLRKKALPLFWEKVNEQLYK